MSSDPTEFEASHGSRRWWAPVARAWRLLATAFSFAVFGLAGLILSVFVLPFVWLLVHPASRRAAVGRRIVGWAFYFFVQLMRFTGCLRYRIRGLEHRADTRRTLIVANHPSLIDVVFLLALFRHSDCVVKASHWKNPCMMMVLRTAGFIPNSDPGELMAECIARLKTGATIVLFPEGTRTEPGEPPVVSRGAATIAVRAQARCLPVRLRCTPTTLTKSERWYDIPPGRVMFEVDVLAPIDSAEFLTRCDSERQAAIAMHKRLFKTLFTPLAKPDR
ncbi:MAG: lysophospholipid acyltransferase family protein [Gammaproteobacteria bacterium]